MRTQPSVESEPLRFRAATLDEAIELAEQSLGSRARVVAANHVRRGGIAGFFASDLGVEVSVMLEDETVEEALGRLVDEAAAEERGQRPERGADLPMTDPSQELSFAAALRMVDDETAAAASASVAGVIDTFTPHTPVSMPASPINPVSPINPAGPINPVSPARSLAAFAAAAATPAPAPGPAVAVGAVESATKMERLEAAFAQLRSSMPKAAPAGAAAPTRRQVELVVAAAEQLIDTVSRRHADGQLSVRVMLRHSNGAELEAHAQWGQRSGVGS